MADVVSFRPSIEEREILDRTCRRMGFTTRAEALRYLLQKGAARAGPLSGDPVWKFRVPKRFRSRSTVTSRQIDDELYGRRPR